MHSKANLQVFLSLFLVIIVDTMGLGLVFPVLSPLVLEQASVFVDPSVSISVREMFYGAIIGVFSFFLLIGAPLLGEVSDSIGRKKALLICLAGTGLSFFFCAAGIWIAAIGLLFFGRALNGFTAGSSSIAQAAIADMSTTENKAKNLGLITLANCFGFVLGPIFGGYFADHPLGHFFIGTSASYATPFLMAGVLTLINIVFLLIFVKDNHDQVRRKMHLQLSMGIRIFIDAIRMKSVRSASLLFLCLQLAWSIYFQFISIILVHIHQYTPTRIGLFMTFIGLLFTFCLSCLLRLCLRFSSLKIVMRTAFIVLAGSLLASAFMRSELDQWLIAIPITFSVGLLYTGGLTLFSNAVNKSQQGWVMGVSAAVAAAAWTLGAIFAGILGKWGVEWPFILATLCSLMGFIFSLKKTEYDHH